jgi:hypothetical protein
MGIKGIRAVRVKGGGGIKMRGGGVEKKQP